MPFRSSSKAQRPRRRRIRKLRLLALLTVLGLVASASFSFGLVTAIAREVPKLDPENQKSEVNGYIYASNGETILAVLRGSESRVLVEPDEIAPIMKQAIVAVEDRRFWDHRGIDMRGIGRALWADVSNKKFVQGGSTITQQYVKNAYIDDERTIARKVREAALSWQLEQQWTKDEILTAYLNTIYFGNGAYGIQQAARIYFDRGASSLTLAEAALLAGIPVDPTAYDPVTQPRAARERREVVLRAMLAQGDISSGAFAAANTTPLPRPNQVRLPGIQGPAPYFTNYVKEQLVDRYGPRRVFGGGLRVTTTIDLQLQQMAREAIAKELTDPEGPTAALVAIDPRDGRVLAMVGGSNYRESQFNLAVQGERQAGSAFKPFVLATALEQGISPSTTFVSKPVLISLGDRFWSVSNYDDVYLGPINLETATIQSDNAVYAELTRIVGPKGVVRTARRLGVTSPLQSYLSIGLGAQAVNPLEMARAFSAFANGGYRIDTKTFGNKPRAVLSVAQGEGEPVVNHVEPRRMLTTRSASYVNSLLQRVVSQGTGKRAQLTDRPAAGKTGTTENYGDAWYVGYTPQLVVAVWVGYPNLLRPMLTEFGGEAVAGGTVPALIWKSFVEKAHEYHAPEVEFFDPPPLLYATPKLVVNRDGVVKLDNGNCRTRREIVYFGDFGPRQRADCKPNEVEVPRVVGRKLEDAKARLAAQPLNPVVVYKPAAPRQRVDIVIGQDPLGGRLSSFDDVKVVMAKPVHGVVPSLVGLTLRKARGRLRRVKLKAEIAGFSDGAHGRVVSQAPPGGVAAAPGMSVRIVVGRG